MHEVLSKRQTQSEAFCQQIVHKEFFVETKISNYPQHDKNIGFVAVL